MRVEALARALGVSKGGFYNHFDDRPALLAGMLETWERMGVDEVIERLEAEGGDAKAKLERLFALASSNRHQLRVELAIRDWARHDKAVARRLRRVDNRRLAYIRTLFGEFCADPEEVELRCLIVLSLFVGVPSLAADYGPRRRAELHRRAFERVVES